MNDLPPGWGTRGQPLQGGLLNTLWRVGDVVVRWSTARSEEHVRGEQDFVRHLEDRGVAVAGPRAAQDGRWRVPWRGGLATGWAWSPGTSPPTVDRPLAERWGRHLAQMHHAAADWTGPRPRWRDDRWWCDREALLADDPELLSCMRSTVRGVGDGPACHGDHGPQNVHVHRGTITSFDFDNACFQPLGLDLAVPISVLARQPRPEATEAAFLNGYAAVRGLPASFLAERAQWLGRRRMLVHLSRLALWSTPTAPQRTWLADHRRRLLGAPM